MRTAWQTFPIEFTGGLVTNLPTLKHGSALPGSASALQNFEPSVEGGYKKILGYQKWNEFVVPGTGVITGVVATAFRDAIAVRDGIYYTSTAQADWQVKLDLSSTPGNKIRHCTFNFNGTPKVCMVDGVNKPVFWDSGSGNITQDTGAPSDVQGAYRVTSFKNHLFFGKGPNLIFTSPFDETDYDADTGAGVINVGSNIVGLIVFREQLIVFSVDKIQRIVGNTSSDFVLQPIAENTGAFCGDTVQEVGGDVLYLGPDGVRFLSATERIGDFALARASEQIQGEVSSLFEGCGNYSSVVIRNKSQYRLFRYDEELPEGRSQGFLGTRFMDREAKGIEWAEVVGFKVYNSDSKVFNEEETILFCNKSDYIYQMDVGFSFDGKTIEAFFRTPFIPIEDPRIRKTFYKHTLYLKTSGDFELRGSLLFDYLGQEVIQPPPFYLGADQSSVYFWGSPSTVWGSFTYGGNLKDVYSSNALGSGFSVALSYYDNSTNPSYSIDTAVLEFKLNDRK